MEIVFTCPGPARPASPFLYRSFTWRHGATDGAELASEEGVRGSAWPLRRCTQSITDGMPQILVSDAVGQMRLTFTMQDRPAGDASNLF